MTLSAEQLEATFAKQRALRDALLEANKAAQPKPPSIWPSVLQFALKAVPPDAIAKLITDGGKALIARRQEAEADKPIQPVQPKPPPVQKADGSRQPAVSGLVGTLLGDDKAVETAKP